MEFQPVLLWTDLLLFVLVAGALLMTLHVRRHEPLRAAWRKVGQRPAGMASMTVLMAFVVIGLLDSMHFRAALPPVEGQPDAATIYSSEVLSVLDHALAPLRLRTEKTYSAPFADRLYQRETVELAGGGQTRIYPRLEHGGSHLPEGASIAADLAQHLVTILSHAGIAMLAVLAVLTLVVGRGRQGRYGDALRAILCGHTTLAWRAALVTTALISLLVAAAYVLAPLYHVIGTDKVGQDVLYLSLKSVRTALVIGTITTLVMLPFAVALGIAAGYLGGWVDDAIQYLYTVLNAIPGVLLIAAAVLMMQVVIDTHPDWFETAAERSDARLLALCFILGITSWTGLCRLLRGETLKLRELEYVQAARAFGASTATILRRHILPNVMHIVMIALVMDFSGLVLAEAVLSYVGIGVDPTTISFGTMINMARAELAREPMVWWSLAAAFAFMFVLVLAANLFADVVRDAFDPRR